MKPSQKAVLITASIFCASAIAFGAFGAHALKNLLESTGRVAVFETASKYHFFHGLGLFVVFFLREKIPSRTLTAAFWSMTAGTFIFSGSLYFLCLFDAPKLGMITPLGGIALICSWLLVAFAAKHIKASAEI